MSINPTKCQAHAKEMSLAVYNGAAIQGGVKLQHVRACLERHRACRDTLRWKQAREMAVREESAAGDVWSMQRGEETDADAS